MELKIPKINWIPFDKDNPPTNLADDQVCLILLREDNYDNGKTWTYHTDVATPFGEYIGNFWSTENDWYEGQLIEVLAYAELPTYLSEKDLVETEVIK